MELVFNILFRIFDTLAGVSFVLGFTKAEKLRGKRLLLLVLFGAVMLFSGMVSTGIIPKNGEGMFILMNTTSMPAVVLQTVSLAVIAFVFGKGSIVRRVTAPFIFSALAYFVNSGYIYMFFGNIVNHPSPSLFVVPYTAIIAVVIAKSFMASVLIACVKIVNYNGRYRILTRGIFILSPIFTMFTLYLFLKILYYRVSEYRFETFVAVFGTVCVNLLIFILFDRTLNAEIENSELRLFKNKASLERRRYAEIMKINEELATLKHDIKNHLLYVSRLAETDESGKLGEYVSSLGDMLKDRGSPLVTGNSMIDYIISSKLKDESNIAFVSTGVPCVPEGMDELDLAVMMGNLMDNAIDAVSALKKEEKLIEMNFSDFNGYRNITVRNDIEGSVLKGNAELKTTKTDKKQHGFGMRSIKNIAQKYDGIIECYEEDGKFCVHLAFPA
ncbi:MAG: GHKL domain-containing protein [Clostridia bacterium]|nr:GHKL domain-containing protein [Clostridia bacterium]